MPGMRLPLIVADTGVLVSALTGKSLRPILIYLRDNRFRLVFSEVTLEELVYVLKRPKFKKYFTTKDIQDFLFFLNFHSTVAIPFEKINDCRDSKDNIFLECAIAGEVDYIVSSDSDLLILTPYRGIPVIPPRKFLKLMKKKTLNR